MSEHNCQTLTLLMLAEGPDGRMWRYWRCTECGRKWETEGIPNDPQLRFAYTEAKRDPHAPRQ